MAEKISIIIPVLNEAESLGQFLLALSYILSKSPNYCFEVIIVDGGSHDKTCAVVNESIKTSPSHVLLVSEGGRAKQMNTGAKHATGSLFLFLHADTFLSITSIPKMMEQLAKKNKRWGRFNVKLSGHALMFRFIAFMINWRSRVSGIATGDQAIFVRRSLFKSVNGYADIPLMEDVAFSKACKKIESPLCLRERVNTSSRRWEKHGIWKTIFLMWQLRLDYFVGVSPVTLKKKYL